MENSEIHNLHPSGWETDPAEERYRLSTIDLTPNCAYNHYVLFFRLRHERTAEVAEVLKTGLERTLRYVSTSRNGLGSPFSFLRQIHPRLTNTF